MWHSIELAPKCITDFEAPADAEDGNRAALEPKLSQLTLCSSEIFSTTAVIPEHTVSFWLLGQKSVLEALCKNKKNSLAPTT